MKITKNLDGNVLTVEIEGRIDTTTAPEFEQSITEYLGKVECISIDFTKVEYVSSAGLRVLLMIQKGMTSNNGKFVIKHVRDEVMEVFDMTGFSSFLNIED